MNAVNLDAYFARIGYRSRDDLPGLLQCHMRSIPFENLDVLLGKPPRIDLPSLEEKLVEQKRGGYCYEHATLFAAVLTELGFAVKTHSARVVMVTPRERAPRTHMFLTVGDFMLDPGFGGLAPLVPVPLDGTPAGQHCIVRDADGIALEHAGKPLWVSSLEHDLPIDFEMANHFTATWPQSPFVQRMMARAFTETGEVRIANRDVTVNGEKRVLADRKELRALVATYFGFDLPALETICVPSIPEWNT
jgi:N-hydroxyarylamine O-acetyltransferase